MRQKSVLLFLLTFFISVTSFSNTAFTNRTDVQSFITTMVKQHQFNKKELYLIMNQVVIQPQIIESIDKPYEKKNWDVYSALFLTPQRLKEGLDFWHDNQALLNKAQERFGVPAEIIVAILGVETFYGTRQGQYRVLDALATLAFNYPKRAPFFTNELKEYLLLCKEQKIPATHYYGSYAGAIGQPQFMPSSYRQYAVDFTNKGKIDLVADNGAVIGSVANYFHKHGWSLKDDVVQQAKIKGSRYQTVLSNPKFANYSYTQLQAAGIKPKNGSYKHPAKAGLIELTTEKGQEYWVAYPNFFVITRYNTSPQYALVVYLLSQQLKTQWAQRNSQKPKAYV
ncbi:MAG: lytic murein transglycosylase B [Legionella sp.]|nr:lytic murein transglycosylase B [Legionella sp.]